MAQFTSHAGQEMVVSEPRHNTQGKRILWVDGTEFGLGDAIRYSSDDDTSMDETPKVMKKLRQFIEADTQEVPSERIDFVSWFVYHKDNPTVRMWHVLDGLSPKHLELEPSV
jgi:hypothetical protein